MKTLVYWSYILCFLETFYVKVVFQYLKRKKMIDHYTMVGEFPESRIHGLSIALPLDPTKDLVYNIAGSELILECQTDE